MAVDRERLARAITGHSAFPKLIIEAILADVHAQGYVIVPREPTEAMLEAGDPNDRDRAGLSLAYKFMISAVEEG